jgi:hypothetical protein
MSINLILRHLREEKELEEERNTIQAIELAKIMKDKNKTENCVNLVRGTVTHKHRNISLSEGVCSHIKLRYRDQKVYMYSDLIKSVRNNSNILFSLVEDGYDGDVEIDKFIDYGKDINVITRTIFDTYSTDRITSYKRNDLVDDLNKNMESFKTAVENKFSNDKCVFSEDDYNSIFEEYSDNILSIVSKSNVHLKSDELGGCALEFIEGEGIVEGGRAELEKELKEYYIYKTPEFKNMSEERIDALLVMVDEQLKIYDQEAAKHHDNSQRSRIRP